MNDASGTNTCMLCGQTLQLLFREVLDPQTREIFQVLACPSCRHACTWPVPEIMEPYYGAAYHGGRHIFTANYCSSRRLRLMKEVTARCNGRRLLDVGCGDGTFLLKAKQHGWEVTGTEINPHIALKAGLNVYNSLEEAAHRAPFDCISLWHVLEHLKNPLAELESIHKLLDPEGVLIIAVPNARSTQAKIFGSKWFSLDVPRHLQHFGMQSLELHLAKTGFAVNSVWHGEFEYDLLGWSQSALNCLLADPNAFFEILLRRKVSGGFAKQSAHVLLGSLFCAFSLLPTWWGMMTGCAGTLILTAKKR